MVRKLCICKTRVLKNNGFLDVSSDKISTIRKSFKSLYAIGLEDKLFKEISLST